MTGVETKVIMPRYPSTKWALEERKPLPMPKMCHCSADRLCGRPRSYTLHV